MDFFRALAPIFFEVILVGVVIIVVLRLMRNALKSDAKRTEERLKRSDENKEA